MTITHNCYCCDTDILGQDETYWIRVNKYQEAVCNSCYEEEGMRKDNSLYIQDDAYYEHMNHIKLNEDSQ